MENLDKLSKALPFIKELEELKKEVDAHRPFSKDLEARVFQKLRLDWNYNSNAIEGNSFTRGETVSLLMEGITAKGKPLKDALDIKGHNQAIDFVLSLIKEARPLSESDIRALHKLVLGEDFFSAAETDDGKPTRKIIKAGQYKTQPNHVKTPTGEIHYYAIPEDTPAKMQELMTWYSDAVKEKKANPVVIAALFHHKLVEIHPFDDGNGRMTRLLTNFILLKFGYPVSVIKQENRRQYYAALSQADNGEVIPIIEIISETVKNAFQILLIAIDGQDISEEDDLDKEIELFRKEIGFRKDYKVLKKDVDIANLLFQIIKYPSEKLYKFSDLFRVKQFSIGGNRKIVGFSKNEIKSIDSFKGKINSSSFPNMVNLEYKFTFVNPVHSGKSAKVEKSFSISFDDETYTITVTGNRLTKYYDEEVYDERFKNLIRIYLKHFMNEIKKLAE